MGILGSDGGTTDNSGGQTNTSTSTGGEPTNTNTSTGGDQTPAWLNGVEADLLNDPIMKNVKDVPSLVKSYVHAQRMIGKDKVVLPTQNSSKEEWQSLYQKLGLPEADKYTLDLEKNDYLSDDDTKALTAKAHELGVLPSQLKEIASYFIGKNNDIVKNHLESVTQQVEATKQELQKEWGEGYNKKLNQAVAVIKQFGDDTLLDYLEQTGMANDGKFIRLLSKIGESLTTEDSFPSNVRQSFNMTPDEAKSEINRIMGDFNSPYYNKNHMEHNDTIARVQKLYGLLGDQKVL